MNSFGSGLSGLSGLSQNNSGSKSGTLFAITIPIAGTFLLTATGNITGMTGEVWGSGDGVTKGDYSKTANLIFDASTVLRCALNIGDVSDIENFAGDVVYVGAACSSDSPSGNVGDTSTVGGGDLNDPAAKISGTTASASLAFNCPIAIYSIAKSGTNDALITTFGPHGLSTNLVAISKTGDIAYDAAPLTCSIPSANTILVPSHFSTALGASNTPTNATVVGIVVDGNDG